MRSWKPSFPDEVRQRLWLAGQIADDGSSVSAAADYFSVFYPTSAKWTKQYVELGAVRARQIARADGTCTYQEVSGFRADYWFARQAVVKGARGLGALHTPMDVKTGPGTESST